MRSVLFILLAVIVFLTIVFSSSAYPGPLQDNQIRIGVLAKRGEDKAHTRWDATADYLSRHLPAYHFDIVPLNFDEIHSAVEDKQVEFVLANSAIYVDLEVRYGVTRLATLRNLQGGEGYTVYAGTIFTRADRVDIQTLEDLHDRSFMAVDERSFGGFIMAWRELMAQGIDPYRDFSELTMAGTHDAVVYSVATGQVDAGTVRSDTLERMAEEGNIDLADFRVLNLRSRPELAFQHSTQLYPEWPFAKVAGVSDALAQSVAISLLELAEDSEVARTARIRGWTIPHEYQPVHDCLKVLRLAPYMNFGQITTGEALRRLWPWFSFGTLMILIGYFTTLYLMRTNRKLTESRAALVEAHNGLEEKVTNRTRDLEFANRQLRTEIEERRRSEEALSEEQAKLELITRDLGAGFIIISRDYRTLMANKVVKEIFGDVEGKVCYQTFSQQQSVCPDCGVRKIFEEGASQAIHEQLGVDAEGNDVWSQIIATPLRDESGEVRAAIEVLVPITERKRTEEDLRNALKDAEEARDKVDNIVESVLNGLIVTDLEGRIISINEVALKMLDVLPGPALGCFASEMFSRHGLEEDFTTFLESIQGNPAPWEFEISARDGRGLLTFQTLGSVMRNQQEVITGTVLVFLDVSKDRELTRLKDSFISTAAHELHTPLTSIVGYSELLLNAEENDSAINEHRKEFLQEIVDKGLSLSRIVDELLDVSRIELGQPIPLLLKSVCLKTLVEKSIIQYRQFCPQHEFVLEVGAGVDNPLAIDPEKITQVLENLLSNAVKYSPSGGRVQLLLTSSSRDYQVAVKDEGVGMSKEQVDKIFDKFYRADNADPAVRGLGLGMGIARQIIENHGGHIWVSSRQGEGTQVYFTLPVREMS